MVDLTPATLTASATGATVIDGVTLVEGMVVTLKDQTDATENGVWLVTVAGATGVATELTRHPSFFTREQLADSPEVVVQDGATQANTKWLVEANVGSSDDIIFKEFSFGGGGGGGVPAGPITTSGLTMATGKLLGRTTAATGAVEELTAVPAANFPALTGDATTAGASLATTVVRINGVALSGLATGILKNTTGTGVPSIAVAGDFPTLNQSTTGSAATLTTSRNFSIAGGGITAATVGFNGSAAVVLNASVDNDSITYAKIQNVSATSRIMGRITAAAGDMEELTGTQATTLLDTFTSALKGLAPASGGGTVNFLRADGTWGVPPGAGGVSDGDKGDVVVSASATVWTVESAAADFLISHVAAPVTPAADKINLHGQRMNASGGRVFTRYRGEDGIYTTLQPHFGRNSVGWAQAGQGSSADLNFQGLAIGGTAGTLTARQVATTNRVTRARRANKVSAATAGALADWYANGNAQTQWTVGGASGAGFMLSIVWAVSDAATVAGAHMFLGMSTSTSAPVATTNPNTLVNVIGVAQLNGGANLNIVYGGSAAQTSIDLGASFPAADTAALYEAIFYARPDVNNKVTYRVENISTGAVASGELTGTAGTALPANTTLLGPRFFRSNNATALAVGLDIARIYIESDI